MYPVGLGITKILTDYARNCPQTLTGGTKYNKLLIKNHNAFEEEKDERYIQPC